MTVPPEGNGPQGSNELDPAHLGLDRLSDLEEGLLPDDEAQAARDHLAGCAQCQDDAAALASVRDAFAGAVDLAMPADVADAIHAALSALPPLSAEPAAEPAATLDTAAPEVAAAVTTLPAQLPKTRWETSRKPVLQALAAAAAIALITLGAVKLPLWSGSSSSEKAAAEPTTVALPAVRTVHSGTDYTGTDLGPDAAGLLAPANGSSAGTSAAATVVAAAAATTGGVATTGAAATIISGAAASTAAPAPASAAAAPTAGGVAEFSSEARAGTGAAAPATTGAAPTTGGAPAATGLALTNGAAGGAAGKPAAPTTDVLAPLRVPGAALACLNSLLSSTEVPLVIDFASFEGRPAVIAVLNDPNDPGRLRVVAVGPPGCELYDLVVAARP